MTESQEIIVSEAFKKVAKQELVSVDQKEEFLLKAKYPLTLGLDHPSVKKVIEIARELTKENRLITTELLYNIAKKELKIPRSGLIRIIQILLNNKILVEGSKFTKLTILKNKTRNYIYWLIKTYIGAHFSFLKELFSIQKERKVGVGQLTWHLEKLLKFNLIKKVKVKNYNVFLPIEIDNNIGIIYFILRDEINRKIVDLILQENIIDRTDIYKQLEQKRENLYYHIKKLIEFNIISPVIEDEKSITINPNKKNLINEVINNISYRIPIKEQHGLISMNT